VKLGLIKGHDVIAITEESYITDAIFFMKTNKIRRIAVNVIKRGGVGVIGDIPVINLPGQVVSAITVFHEHGLHILSRMIGKEVRKFSYYFLDQGIISNTSLTLNLPIIMPFWSRNTT